MQKNRIQLNLRGEISEVVEGARLLSDVLGFSLCESGIPVTVQKADKGHDIILSNGGITLNYSTLAGFFRALTISLYHVSNGSRSFECHEDENFDMCGVMIDVSRGTVPKVATLKRFLTYMARMGLNMLMLYMEDIYKIDEYPYFGYMRGAYSGEELRELVAFAEKLGIEMIPCIQTLGHLAKALRWKAHEKLRDTDNVLMIGEEETRRFVESMIKTLREYFPSKRIHIGMDEAHGVGLGKYIIKHGYQDRYEILLRHLNMVVELCRKYDFEPMMWSDMFFRLGSKTNDYYDLNAEMPPNIKELIPDGVSQVYWDYYHGSKDIYQSMLTAHKSMGCDIIFAGGVWTWTGFSPRYTQTMNSTHPALAVCREQGIKDVFATIWFSDYSECSIFAALLGLQLYAEYQVSDKVSDERLEEMFQICTGHSAKNFMLLDADDFGAENPVNDPDAPYSFGEIEHCIPVISKQVLYQDILCGLFDKNFEMLDLRSHYEKLSDQLSQMGDNGDLEDIFEVQRLLVDVLMRKCDIGIRLKKAYDSDDRKALETIIAELKELLPAAERLHEKFAQSWYQDNKGFGFEEHDMRLSGVEGRIKGAIRRVSAYLSGEADRLEELEEDRLEYEARKTPFVHLYYVENMRRA